jgi:Tfp pilus assembly protein PilO
MTPLLARILREKRPHIVILGVGLLINLLAYVLIVQPRGVRAAGAADRAAAAASARSGGERELAAAEALVTGKSRADEELNEFYRKVLPAGREAARRMMDRTLPALAEETGVRWLRRTSEVSVSDDERLTELTVNMVLQGEYDDLRDFLYAVESGDQFIILDDVMLSEGRPDEPLTLAIRLSTFFRAADGA